MFLRVFIFCAIFACAFSAECSSSDSHDLTNCPDPVSANVTLFDQLIFIKGSILTTHEEIVSFPDGGVNPHIIHCVIVEDQSHENQGACAQIQEGGTGYYNVKIRLTSQRGKDINSRVQVYGSTVDLNAYDDFENDAENN